MLHLVDARSRQPRRSRDRALSADRRQLQDQLVPLGGQPRDSRSNFREPVERRLSHRPHLSHGPTIGSQSMRAGRSHASAGSRQHGSRGSTCGRSNCRWPPARSPPALRSAAPPRSCLCFCTSVGCAVIDGPGCSVRGLKRGRIQRARPSALHSDDLVHALRRQTHRIGNLPTAQASVERSLEDLTASLSGAVDPRMGIEQSVPPRRPHVAVTRSRPRELRSPRARGLTPRRTLVQISVSHSRLPFHCPCPQTRRARDAGCSPARLERPPPNRRTADQVGDPAQTRRAPFLAKGR